MINERFSGHKLKDNIQQKETSVCFKKWKANLSFVLPSDFSLHCCWFFLAASVALGQIHFRVSAPRSVQRQSPEMKYIPCNITHSVFYHNQAKWSSIAQRPLHSCQSDWRDAVVPGPGQKDLCSVVANSTLPCIVTSHLLWGFLTILWFVR